MRKTRHTFKTYRLEFICSEGLAACTLPSSAAFEWLHASQSWHAELKARAVEIARELGCAEIKVHIRNKDARALGMLDDDMRENVLILRELA